VLGNTLNPTEITHKDRNSIARLLKRRFRKVIED
jgi:hypothetical protein